MYGDAIHRRKQEDRVLFISDVTAAVSGLSGKEGAKSANDYIKEIESAARED